MFLSVAYFVVNRFDGACDGIVAVESAKWGDFIGLVKTPGVRGMSHGDVVDMRRRDIKGFDIRGFYIGIVEGLAGRGF